MSSSITIFRLLDKKVDNNSHFVNEDGTIDHTKKIDFTHSYGVLNPYFIMKKGVREYRQFIRGCSFFEPAKQKEQGYIPDVNNSVVEFKAGGDIILDDEDDATLILWLKDHPLNTKSSFHNKDKHDKVFFTYDPKEVQKEEAKMADAEDEAMQIVISLRNDEARLIAIGNLFESTMGMSDNEAIYLELRRLAKEDPSNFSASIANRENSVLGDIKLAQKLAVINRDAKGFYYEGKDGVIFEPAEKQQAKAEKELVKFLMSKEGSEHYKEILIQIEQKQVRMNAPEGSTIDPVE